MTDSNAAYEWNVVVEPAVDQPGVADPTASMTATLPDLDTACYWISDLAEIGKWNIAKATITRIPAHNEVKND